MVPELGIIKTRETLSISIPLRPLCSYFHKFPRAKGETILLSHVSNMKMLQANEAVKENFFSLELNLSFSKRQVSLDDCVLSVLSLTSLWRLCCRGSSCGELNNILFICLY